METQEENTIKSLHSAAEEGNIEEIRCLLKEDGVLIDERDERGETPLMKAVMCEHIDVVKVLVSAGANVTLRSIDYPLEIENQTVLHMAIRNEKSEIIKFLLQQKHIPVNQKDRYGQTPLLTAPLYANKEILELLISSGADITASDLEGKTVLHSVASAGKLDNLLYILQQNKIPINTTDMEGDTPLMRVTKWYWKTGKDKAIDALLKAGADINIRDQNGNSPIRMAARTDDFSVLKSLLKTGIGFSWLDKEERLEILCMLAAIGKPPLCKCMKEHCITCERYPSTQKISAEEHIAEVLSVAGIQPNYKDESGNIIPGAAERQIVDVLVTAGINLNDYAMRRGTPLYNAVESKNKHMITALINAGADVNLKDEGGSPLVMDAVHQKEILALLISFGADVNATDSMGFPPIDYPINLNDYKVMDMLVAAGAHINILDGCGNPPLINAVSRGRQEITVYLINKGADVNICNDCGGTALHVAAREGYQSIVEHLIRAKANVNCIDKEGSTPLHEAARYGHKECEEILLCGGANVNAATKDGVTAVHLAADNGCCEIMKLLVTHGAKLNVESQLGETPLHCAAKCKNSDVLKYLLELELPADVKDNDGNTALHSAAKAGSIRVVEFLLDKKIIHIDEQNCAGQTPLMVATQPEIAKALLHAGAYADMRDNEGKTALHLAAARGTVQLLKELIAGSASIGLKDKCNRTALHWAATSGDTETLQYLLQFCLPPQTKEHDSPDFYETRGSHTNEKTTLEVLLESTVNVNDQDEAGLTPLMLTVEHAHRFSEYEDVLKLLLQRGAHIAARNWKGKTALHMAIEESSLWVMESLLSIGADPRDLEYEYINAALHVAARGQNCQIVKQLISAGAEPATRSSDSGSTILHVASSAGCVEIVEYLLGLNIPVDEKDVNGQTALHYAAYEANVRTAKRLLEKGHAAVDTCDDKGRTPLMVLARGWRDDCSREDLTELLLLKGANLHARDLKGKTPLQIATRHSHPNVVELLKKLSYVSVHSKN